MVDTREFVAKKLSLASRAIECGRDAVQLPNGYLNFDVALAIVAGCRNALVMADAHDTNTMVQQLQNAATSLAYMQSGLANVSVQTARTHIEETIAALRPHEESEPGK
jgi:hypothetical protein